MTSVFRRIAATASKAAGATAVAATVGFGALGAAPAQAEEIIITIERVKALDKIDGPLAGQADFYAVAIIDGKEIKSPVIKRQDDIQPNWVLTAPVGRGTFDVKLEILDKNVLKKDALIDINRLDGKRDLDFKVDTRNCQVKGFSKTYDCRQLISRGGNEKKMAEIFFTVDVRK